MQPLLQLRGHILARLVMIGQDDDIAPGQRREVGLGEGFTPTGPGHAGIVAKTGRGIGAFLALADQHGFGRFNQQLRQAVERALIRQ
ncbi:hypothetical protein [Paracoccus litorisediminis]|uniref:Uncharacterized protein n=1 Tax=Paracoccus litorisediminis TaxID=2006130 RepID=A0A844HTT7_9RHOB|nr:hypothetical protein [Paracoccus litorisediminis]MTH61747.1 hypothetical protein [Paracoccus litorisediminis]